MKYSIPNQRKQEWTRTIELIAFNQDGPLEMDYATVVNCTPVIMMAESFGVPDSVVANAVLKRRRQAKDWAPK